jgi:hypothetical protein
MSPVHIHLMLNHIPVIGMILALLLFAVAAFRKSVELIRVVLALFVLLALVCIPVYLTGEPSEEIVEDMPGVSHDFIEEHEEAAAFALASIEVLGVASIAGLILFRSAMFPQWFVIVILVLSIGCAVAMGRTGNLGGQIRHSEIRSGASPAEPHDSD